MKYCVGAAIVRVNKGQVQDDLCAKIKNGYKMAVQGTVKQLTWLQT